jgi:undecaprenyl-diphosphatase
MEYGFIAPEDAASSLVALSFRVVAPPPLGRVATWASAAASAAGFGVFTKLSQVLVGSGGVAFRAVDASASDFAFRMRHPMLTRITLDVTAVGTPSVLGVFVVGFAFLAAVTRDRLAALLLLSASAGAIGWTSVLKNLIERERPPLSSRLVVTSGYSFPSGHSLASAALLMAFAVIVCRHLQSRLQQVTVFSALGLLMCAVAASRVYLGVHYFSDVVAGTSFGLAWTFCSVALLAAVDPRYPGRRRAMNSP